MADVQGRCPACGGASLFLGEGGHVTCSRLDCPAPDTADALLHGGETALIQSLGGDRKARVIAHTLHFHGHSLADVRRMTDEQLLAIPGIGEPSLARIRAAIPAPDPDPATEEQSAPVDWQAIARQRERELKTVGERKHAAEQERDQLRQALHVLRYGMARATGNDFAADYIVNLIDITMEQVTGRALEPCDADAQAARANRAEATIARVRAEVARIRAVTRTWEPVADLIDAALDGADPAATEAAEPAPSPLRDQVAEALLDHLSRTADIRPGRSGELAFMPEVTDAERLRIADAVLAVIDPHGDTAAAIGRGHRCFLENHVTRIHDAEAAVARVRAESARIRATTRTWEPVADRIDAALDGTNQPREQRERPAHPDGTPYSYAEMVAEGWEFCDGCRMWSTATPERPHQCPETHMRGPVVGTARITVDVSVPKSADLADAVRTALRREANRKPRAL